MQIVGGAWHDEIGKLATVLSLAEGEQVATVAVDGARGTLSLAVANLREGYGRGPLWDACVQREVELRDAARRYERAASNDRESQRALDEAAIAFAVAERTYFRGIP